MQPRKDQPPDEPTPGGTREHDGVSSTITAPGESFFRASQAVGVKTFFRSEDGSLHPVGGTRPFPAW